MIKINNPERDALLGRFPVAGAVVATRRLMVEPGTGKPGSLGHVVGIFDWSTDKVTDLMFKIQWTDEYAAWHLPSDLMLPGERVENAREFGGHEFEYEKINDLFKCVYCERFEAVVRDTWTQKIEPCKSRTQTIAAAEAVQA